MTASFHTQRIVEFHDTDMAGIMHFAAFFRYMESAEHEFIRSLGLSVHSKINELTVSFPRVAASCEYQSPVRCEETLDIEIVIARLGDKSITYAFTITCQSRPVATGQITCVCCQLEEGQPPRSITIPPEIRTQLEPYAA